MKRSRGQRGAGIWGLRLAPFAVVATMLVCNPLFAQSWDEHSGSCPIKATVPPAAPDITCPFPSEAVELSGLLRERVLAHAQNRLLRIDEGVLLGGFRKRPGSHPWIGEHVGKWLHAACLLCQWSKNDELRKKIDRVAQGLIATQEADGYLGTYEPSVRLGNAEYSDWDVWVHKYDLLGLLSYYGISSDPKALKACVGIGDLLCSAFMEKQSIAKSGPHVGMASTSVLEPVVLLYPATGERRYLNLAERIVQTVEAEGGSKLIGAILQDKTVLSVGNRKAYEMLSNYVGLCELYRSTGKTPYLEAARTAWEDVAKNRLYITGSASAGEFFQKDGDLPNHAGAHIQETCVTVTWMQLNWQLLRLTADEKYAAALEKTLFNQLLGAQCPDGSCFAYYNPLDGFKQFSPNYPPDAMDCCNSSGPRGLGLSLTCLATLDRGGLRINTYAPGEWKAVLKGTPVAVGLKSHFPSDGEGVLEVRTARPIVFSLFLRIPRWAERTEVRVNGKPVSHAPGTYCLMSRKWRKGDRVTFSFPFRTEVRGGQGTNRGLIAVTRGPIVYAFDQLDNPSTSPRCASLSSLEVEDLHPRTRRAGESASWPEEVLLEVDAVDLLKKQRGEDGRFRAVLRPFFDAGPVKSSFAVWLKPPGATLGEVSPFLFGKESYSDKGNVEGLISDGDPDTFRVTFNGRPQTEAFFAVEVAKPMKMRRATYVAGMTFHDGGWYDASKGKPRLEIKLTSESAWEQIAVFDSYPATTATDAMDVKQGASFSVSFTSVEAVAVRVVGVPACGDNPGQAFASCAELLAFER